MEEDNIIQEQAVAFRDNLQLIDKATDLLSQKPYRSSNTVAVLQDQELETFNVQVLAVEDAIQLITEPPLHCQISM